MNIPLLLCFPCGEAQESPFYGTYIAGPVGFDDLGMEEDLGEKEAQKTT